MKFQNKRLESINILIITIISLMFFFIFVYPGIDDFSFYHMGTAKLIEESSYISANHINAEFYILTVIISLITNISYDTLPTLPLFLLPLIFLLIAILKHLDVKMPISILLVLIYITQSRNNNYGMFPHDVGLVVSLLIFLLAIYRMRFPHKNTIQVSLLLIVSIISVNLISYKHTYLSLSFLLILQIIELIKQISKSNFNLHKYFQLNDKKEKFLTIILIGFVYTFYFNQWIYGTFFPILKATSISGLSSSSGFNKMISAFFQKKVDPLSNFHFYSPPEIVYSHLIWFILIAFNLVLCSIIILKKFRKNEDFFIHEKFIFSLGLASSFNLFIYSSLGVADISFLLLTSIIGYCLTLQLPSNIKKFIAISIVLLLSINIFILIDSYYKDFYNDIKDKNQFRDIDSFSNWYIKNGLVIVEDNESYITTNIVTFSDYFTDSYLFKKSMVNDNFDSHNRKIISRSQVLTLMNNENNVSTEEQNITSRFVINYNLKRFAVNEWETFRSWSYFKHSLNMNPNIDKIYSSGEIDYLSSREK